MVSHWHSAGNREFPGDSARDGEGKALPMRIRCRVIERPQRHAFVKEEEDALDYGQLSLDQAARTALGIPSQFDRNKVKVQVEPLTVPISQRIAMAMARVCGVNEVFFRVSRPHPIDLDQSAIARLIPDAIPLLGTDYGSKINIDSVVPAGSGWRAIRINVTALELTQTMVERRKHQISTPDNVVDGDGEEIDGIRRRFVDMEATLGVSPDSPSIWLSQPQRLALRLLDVKATLQALG